MGSQAGLCHYTRFADFRPVPLSDMKIAHIINLLLCLLVAGCASTPAPENPDIGEITSEAAQADLEKPLAAQRLADLLIAEVAAQRNRLDLTLGYYTSVARQTENPHVRAQATRLAAFLRDPQTTRDLAALWLESSPGDTEALELAAIAAINQGDIQGASALIDTLLAANPEQSLIGLVNQARGLDTTGNTRLLDALSRLAERYPEQPALWYARALHEQLRGEPDAALLATENALRLRPGHEESLLLRTHLLNDLGRRSNALESLRSALRKTPGMPRAQLLYVRLLIDEGDERQAYRRIKTLEQLFDGATELRLTLALHAIKQQHYEFGRKILLELIEEGFRVNELHLHAAQAAEADANYTAAISHYLSVDDGEYQVRARAWAARLHFIEGNNRKGRQLFQNLRQEHPHMAVSLYLAEVEVLSDNDMQKQARILLDQALGEYPDERELLYARALLAERLDDLATLEADLRKILAKDPTDPEALNALGFTLADRNIRLDEAYDYIQQAFSQRPDNPAIIDSMGWILYRLGRHAEALEYLRQAWELMQDDEVGAHLAEVLLVAGEREAAVQLLDTVRKMTPDSRHLHRLMDQFPDLQ